MLSSQIIVYRCISMIKNN